MSKTAVIVDKNRKPKTKLEKTRKPHKTPKPKNRSFKVRKPKNRTRNWPNPQNRKSQHPPLHGMIKSWNRRPTQKSENIAKCLFVPWRTCFLYFLFVSIDFYAYLKHFRTFNPLKDLWKLFPLRVFLLLVTRYYVTLLSNTSFMLQEHRNSQCCSIFGL